MTMAPRGAPPGPRFWTDRFAVTLLPKRLLPPPEDLIPLFSMERHDRASPILTESRNRDLIYQRTEANP
jgi:hypothetical protein